MGKKTRKNLFFVGILKASDKKRRIRLRTCNPVYGSKDPDLSQTVTDSEHWFWIHYNKVLVCTIYADKTWKTYWFYIAKFGFWITLATQISIEWIYTTFKRTIRTQYYLHTAHIKSDSGFKNHCVVVVISNITVNDLNFEPSKNSNNFDATLRQADAILSVR